MRTTLLYKPFNGLLCTDQVICYLLQSDWDKPLNEILNESDNSSDESDNENENADSENLTFLDVKMMSEKIKNYALKIRNSKLFEKSREINEITSEIRLLDLLCKNKLQISFQQKCEDSI